MSVANLTRGGPRVAGARHPRARRPRGLPGPRERAAHPRPGVSVESETVRPRRDRAGTSGEDRPMRRPDAWTCQRTARRPADGGHAEAATPEATPRGDRGGRGRSMTPGSRAYYEGAAADEVTLRDNQAAFERWRIVPRMMVQRRTRRVRRGARAALADARRDRPDGAPAPGPPRRRGGGRARRRGPRRDHMPVHVQLRDLRGARRDRRRSLVPALPAVRPGPVQGAHRAGRGDRPRGDRAHDGHARPGPPRARPARRLQGPAGRPVLPHLASRRGVTQLDDDIHDVLLGRRRVGARQHAPAGPRQGHPPPGDARAASSGAAPA